MATVTLNQTTKALRIDLTDPEFTVVAALVQAAGTAPIERALAAIIHKAQQEIAERRRDRLRKYVELANPTKLGELATVMQTDPLAPQ